MHTDTESAPVVSLTPLEEESDRRRSRRRPVPGVFVALEAPATPEELCWAGNAIDINGDGLGLAMPPEVEEGSDVLITFFLDGATYARLPGVVLRQHRDFGVGAVRFGEWPDNARLSLLTYLLTH